MSGMLAHSPADVIAQLLVDLALATDVESPGAWPVSVNKDADTPDNTITVRDTAGRDLERTQHGPRVTHHGAQIRVRCTRQPTGSQKIRAITNALDGVYHQSVTLGAATYFVESITVTGDPMPIGTESTSKRELFTVNLLAVMRQTS